jgi:hypothetical protein
VDGPATLSKQVTYLAEKLACFQYFADKVFNRKTLISYFSSEYTTMTVPICEHIKPGGARCGSPALRDKQFCYYHLNLRHAMPLTTMFYAERANPPDR